MSLVWDTVNISQNRVPGTFEDAFVEFVSSRVQVDEAGCQRHPLDFLIGETVRQWHRHDLPKTLGESLLFVLFGLVGLVVGNARKKDRDDVLTTTFLSEKANLVAHEVAGSGVG